MKRLLRMSAGADGRMFVVLLSIGGGMHGGRSTDESARDLYVEPPEYRP